jgi:transposase
MDRSQGKPLSPDVKECIVLLKQYFDRNRPTVGPKELSAQMVADALNVGLATVNRVMASYNKDPKSLNALPKIRGRPDYAVDASLQEGIRAYIREANMKGVYITLEAIREFINDQSANTSFHIITLGRTLERWGFEFGKGIRTQHLKEKDHVIAARHRYLRKIRKNRSPKSDGATIRPEVYLDESYVNKNHSNDFIWYSSDGWVPEAKLVFKSTKKTGDYHGQMNSENFKKWFTDRLIPNIPANSMIIMDNAAYHSVLSSSSAPTSTCSKKRIQQWLEANKCHYNSDCLKSELIELLSKMAPEPSYEIDEIAQQYGHEVVRTPPYHPELQPIEICWGVLKNEIARNCNFTMKNLEIQLENAFNKVTGETCKKIIKGIKAVEDKFWEEDAIMDEREEDFTRNET